MLNEIPRINYQTLCNEDDQKNKIELDKLKIAVTKYGFLIIKNYPIDLEKIENVFLLYKQFFKLPFEETYSESALYLLAFCPLSAKRKHSDLCLV